MKLATMFIILLISSAGGAAANNAGGLQTDCAWWTSFDKFNDVGIDPMLPKLSYVAGVYDGLVFGKSQIRDNFAFGRYEIISAALDTFCSDERNRRIPLVPALRVISMDIKGRKPRRDRERNPSPEGNGQRIDALRLPALAVATRTPRVP